MIRPIVCGSVLCLLLFPFLSLAQDVTPIEITAGSRGGSHASHSPASLLVTWVGQDADIVDQAPGSPRRRGFSPPTVDARPRVVYDRWSCGLRGSHCPSFWSP